MKFKVRLIISVVFIIVSLGAYSAVYEYLYPIRYEHIIYEKALQYDLDPYLVSALIRQESRFNTQAESHKGARGLMQIMPETGEWIAIKTNLSNFNSEKLFDARYNIEMGCWYLSYLLNEFNQDVDLALAAYNGGIGNVKKWLMDEQYSYDGKTLYFIPFNETRNYVKNVTGAYGIYKKIYRNKF